MSMSPLRTTEPGVSGPSSSSVTPAQTGRALGQSSKRCSAAAGFPMIDQFYRIRAGGRWEDEIDEALREAGCILVCWSNTRPRRARSTETHDILGLMRPATPEQNESSSHAS
jgi:hypothetical protein